MAAQIERRLAELLQGLVDGPIADVSVASLSIDSRDIAAGAMFIALSGTRARGHDFIDDAVQAGAVAIIYDAEVALAMGRYSVPCVAVADLNNKAGVIAERFYGHPSRDLLMIGVTGTNGKTSCSHFIAQALNADDRPSAVIGTLGNGLLDSLDQATHTTPDAISLHGLLRRFVDLGAASAVMEVSSHGIEQGRVSGVDFDVALFTNLSRDHLDYHGDMAAYARAKAGLFTMPGLRYAVINADDDFGRSLLSQVPAAVETVVYGMGDVDVTQPLVRGEIKQQDQNGLELAVESPWGKGVIKSSLIGSFNASNLLAVLAVLLVSGVDFDEALAKLSSVKTIPGRVEPFGGEDQPLVIVDYAHTPDALEQVLLTLRAHCEGRLWCVFGCGGDRDKGKRPLMGRAAERHSDRIVITSDNPRHEDSDAIVADIRTGLQQPELAEVIADRAQAISFAIRQASENDVVLIAGKGHEEYQQIGDEKRPFSDRQYVQAVLQEAA